MRMRALVVVGLVFTGCKKETKPDLAAGSGSAATASATTGSNAAGSAAPPPAPPAPEAAKNDAPGAKRLQQLAALSKGKGLKRDDMTVALTQQGDSWVTAKGDQVAEENVIDGGAIYWSPDKKWAVVVVNEGCGDMCHEAAWLVGESSDVTLEGDHPAPPIAWHPTRAEVAIAFDDGDSVETSVFDTSGKVLATYRKYGTPTYQPDGTLTVKNAKGVAFRVGPDGKLTKV